MTKRALLINYIILGVLLVLNICVFAITLLSSDTSRIYDSNIMKCVEIKATDDEETWAYATGFFIDNNGTIITNKHVVYNSITDNVYSIVKVRIANQEDWIDANVTKVSSTDDLAKIEIDKANTQYFDFADNIYNGASIYTIGNPNGFGLSFTSGVISSKERVVNYNDSSINAIQTSFVINEGNSGGPVFDNNGALVGIISFRLKDKSGDVIHGVSFALPTSTINDFIFE